MRIGVVTPSGYHLTNSSSAQVVLGAQVEKSLAVLVLYMANTVQYVISCMCSTSFDRPCGAFPMLRRTPSPCHDVHWAYRRMTVRWASLPLAGTRECFA
jgi:hypothetical protein